MLRDKFYNREARTARGMRERTELETTGDALSAKFREVKLHPGEITSIDNWERRRTNSNQDGEPNID